MNGAGAAHGSEPSPFLFLLEPGGSGYLLAKPCTCTWAGPYRYRQAGAQLLPSSARAVQRAQSKDCPNESHLASSRLFRNI